MSVRAAARPLPLYAPESSPRNRLADWTQPVREGGPLRVMETPRSVELAITGRCNLRCRTCYYADEMTALADLPTASWLSLADELGEMAVMSVLLTGGEPLLHPDLREIVGAVVANRMRFRVNSNGIPATPAVAAFLKDTGRCDQVQVSIDGSCPEVHDRIRGRGSFVGAVAGIRALREAGVPVAVRVTINRVNLRDLPRLFPFLFEELGIEHVGTNEAFPRGAAQCNLKDLDMTPAERREAERTCLEAKVLYPALSASAGPLVMGRMLRLIDEDLARPPEERRRSGGSLSGCRVASQSLAVMHDGKVVPCLQLPHMVLGQAGVDPLRRIWQESVGLEYLRTRHRIPLGRLEECRDCRYQPYCTGGCPAIAYAVTGKTTGRDPRSCYRALKGEDPEFAF